MTDNPTWQLDALAAGPELPKAPTGIAGLDDITGGGLPRGRTTLVVGAAGSGKTIISMEFLVRGARDLGEPGVLISFEETAAKVAQNVTSLGFDLNQLQRDGKLVVQSFLIDPAEIVQTGAFDLTGLFVIVADAVSRVGARRVVFDTIEMLFGGYRDVTIIRSELGRLFRWLEERNLTAIVTSERGGGTLTRHGIEEYVSDCVILLDQRVVEDVSTRRLRVVKYRGSVHGTNEYPFLITGGGVVVQPLSSVGLAFPASTVRISTGVAHLDDMLGGGVFEGTTIMLSGGSGTGKTTLAARMAMAACERGEHALYVLYEESPDQLVRNMRSVGIDLGGWVDAGLLHLHAARPSAYGLENHLSSLTHLVDQVHPTVAVLDALTSFTDIGSEREVSSVVTRMIDLLKTRGITAWVTWLTQNAESNSAVVSSLIDTWLLLRNVESDGERNRLLFAIKSRGSSHSNQVREFVLTDRGPELVEVYLGPEGMLVGSARVSRQAEERETDLRRAAALADRRRDLRRQAAEFEAQVIAAQETLAGTRAELERLDVEVGRRELAEGADAAAMRQQRWAKLAPSTSGPLR